MRDRFTRVLKGHIAIARAVFPDGTTGAQLDTLARQFLWQAGLDFDHGTGHGVGSYLSVHEGPARISKLGTTPLKRGMILSNEPGYYKAGAYGIRIENLVLVVEAPPIAGAEKPMNALRDADAGADRPPADRRRRADARRKSPGSTPITPASGPRCARCSTKPPRSGWTPRPRRWRSDACCGIWHRTGRHSGARVKRANRNLAVNDFGSARRVARIPE